MLVEVLTFRYEGGAALEEWVAGIVTYVDQTGLDVRVAGDRESTRLARWGEGDTWRRAGKVFA